MSTAEAQDGAEEGLECRKAILSMASHDGTVYVKEGSRLMLRVDILESYFHKPKLCLNISKQSCCGNSNDERSNERSGKAMPGWLAISSRLLP